MALTPKQERFVQEYLVDLNATQAAIRAGYSEKTADKIGPELLGKTSISAAIRKAQQGRQKRTEITQDMVIEKLAEIALGKATDFAPEGYPLVKGATNKTSSQLKALELLGKHLGMFEKRDSYDTEDVGDTRKEVFGDG